MDRRRFLRATGLTAAAGVAGCGGRGGQAGTEGQTIADHPATADIDARPVKGNLDGHLVLSFEDPSCGRCAAFHEETVPQIESNIVETGNGAYAFRTYPVVYQWGRPATQALASTFARDEGAFWSLLDFYFTNQSQFSTDNVLPETASFLDDSTSLDGAAVADDARDEVHGDAVQADVDAAEAAGLGSTTPVVLMFKDGEYVTKANGSVSYDVIATALDE